jgi:simple sugar transport system permease protein
MNPFVMILISALLTFMDKGASQIATDFGLNEYVSQIVSGVILFCILGCEFFINDKVRFRLTKAKK